jgi:hypothetical protein
MPFDLAFWSGISTTAFTSIVTSGLVAGIVQVVFKARYDRDLETLKGRMTAENAREIERIRSDSTIAAERFKKSYGLLAERQAEAVETIYKHLAEVHLALLRLVSPGRFGGEPTDPELLQTLHTKRWEGMDYFRAKRLFLPPDLGTEIDALYEKMAGSEMGFRFNVGGMDRSAREWREQGKLWDEANGEIAMTLRDLEAKFRHLLEGSTI